MKNRHTHGDWSLTDEYLFSGDPTVTHGTAHILLVAIHLRRVDMTVTDFRLCSQYEQLAILPVAVHQSCQASGVGLIRVVAHTEAKARDGVARWQPNCRRDCQRNHGGGDGESQGSGAESGAE